MDWKNKITFLIVLIPFLTFGQVDKNFINYLGKNELNNELNTFLKSHQHNFLNPDSALYFKCKLSLQLNDLNSFYDSYLQSENLFSNDSTAMLIASNHHLTAPTITAKLWFSQDSSLFNGTQSLITYKAFHLSENPLHQSPDFLPNTLRHHFNSYQKYYKRKPIIAAGLSMVVPGLGKLYSGRPHGFWPSFLTNVLYGIQTAENIKTLGIKHPYTIFTLGVFSVFYFSNIYGSAHDLKQVKIEKRKKFLHEVSHYYYHPTLFK